MTVVFILIPALIKHLPVPLNPVVPSETSIIELSISSQPPIGINELDYQRLFSRAINKGSLYLSGSYSAIAVEQFDVLVISSDNDTSGLVAAIQVLILNPMLQ